jgi:hypothetical protein
MYSAAFLYIEALLLIETLYQVCFFLSSEFGEILKKKLKIFTKNNALFHKASPTIFG